MNCTQAKRIRREANYHPSMPRKYNWAQFPVQRPARDKKGQLSGGMRTFQASVLELDTADPRSLYQELKKEFYAGEL